MERMQLENHKCQIAEHHFNGIQAGYPMQIVAVDIRGPPAVKVGMYW